MDKMHLAVVPLRVLLVLVFAALVVGQVMSVPGQFRHMAAVSPDLAHLRWPLVVFVELGLVCVQVVIVCTWKLLSLVKDDRIFSERSLVWVDAILGAIAAAWLLLLGLFVYLFFIAGVIDNAPGNTSLLLLMLLAGAVLGLLMVVMRALLRQATTLRTDLDAVV